MNRSWQEVKADKRRWDEANGQNTAEGRATARRITADYIRDADPERTGLGSRIAALFADLDAPAFDDLPPSGSRVRAADFPD